jgi:hypothetical protein
MERLARIRLEERARLGAEARLMAEREFDEAIVTRAYLEVVESLPA